MLSEKVIALSCQNSGGLQLSKPGTREPAEELPGGTQLAFLM